MGNGRGAQEKQILSDILQELDLNLHIRQIEYPQCPLERP